jgi:hypothetical protein
MRKRLLILLPGNPDQAEWVAHYSLLFLYLCVHFEVTTRSSSGNNIYLVRQLLAKEAQALRPDYVLWIDSDNLVTVEGFQHLFSSAEADPDVSIIGAWYYFPASDGIRIAAGRNPATAANMVTQDKIVAADNLMAVGYIGFGMCLMKGQVFQDTAPYHFRPILDDASPEGFMTDDAGFCCLAAERGHKTFLHPAVRVEHLKVMKVPAPAGLPNQKEKENNGDHANSSSIQPELQIVDHHGA